MKKIGIFYGPEKGSTEKIAQLIVRKLGSDRAEALSIEQATTEQFMQYDKFILGIATVGRDTWDSEHGRRGWDLFLPKLTKIKSLEGKIVAIYGLGNHVTYANLFCDSMGMLAYELRDKRATIIGQIPVDGYTFDDSAAIFGGQFVGLPLDEDNEEHLTDERLTSWLKIIDTAEGLAS